MYFLNICTKIFVVRVFIANTQNKINPTVIKKTIRTKVYSNPYFNNATSYTVILNKPMNSSRDKFSYLHHW